MYPSSKSWLKDLQLDMEHIELQDFHLDDQEVKDKIGAMKNLKELRVRSIKMPLFVTSNVLFLPLYIYIYSELLAHLQS
jgi:hypothetical protein